MNIPLLDYPLKSHNSRVASYEKPGEENASFLTTHNKFLTENIENLINAAYRQVFHEQQILQFNRQKTLESQLKFGQITVRDFIKSLVLSDAFRHYNYEVNNNYRFVQICIQRLLGREAYDEREKFAWSIILATKGLEGFIDDLLACEEYLTHFGENTVPYQRRRILPGQPLGELAFTRMPRYDNTPYPLSHKGYGADLTSSVRWEWQKAPYSPLYRILVRVIFLASCLFLAIGSITILLTVWGIISP